jgi:hypothetical protein
MTDFPFVTCLVMLPNGHRFVYAYDVALYEAMPSEYFSDLQTRIDIELALSMAVDEE